MRRRTDKPTGRAAPNGMGTWTIWNTRTGRLVYSEDRPADKEFQNIVKLLDLELVNGQVIGSIMPDFPMRKSKAE